MTVCPIHTDVGECTKKGLLFRYEIVLIFQPAIDVMVYISPGSVC